eukprot:3392992-Lingulodinium_polyedra.AAC.1
MALQGALPPPPGASMPGLASAADKADGSLAGGEEDEAGGAAGEGLTDRQLLMQAVQASAAA